MNTIRKDYGVAFDSFKLFSISNSLRKRRHSRWRNRSRIAWSAKKKRIPCKAWAQTRNAEQKKCRCFFVNPKSMHEARSAKKKCWNAFPLYLRRGHKARSAKDNFFRFSVPATLEGAVIFFFSTLSLWTLGAGTKREAQKFFFSLYRPWNPRGRRHGPRKENFFGFTVPGTLEGAGTAPRKEKKKKKKEKKKKRFATQP